MMRLSTRRWRNVPAAVRTFLLLATLLASGFVHAGQPRGSDVSAAGPAGATTVSLARAGEGESIPIGNAVDDRRTSGAVSGILAACANAYATLEQYSASGVYVHATKPYRGPETFEAARVDLLYDRPGSLMVRLSDGKLSGSFISDGSNVLMLRPSAKMYSRVRQPDSLAAYSEEEYDGEILDDESGSISRATIPYLLMTRRPLEWLHANVLEYYYDGIEDAGGVQCWKIRFLQENPDLVVVNWIDCENRLLRKVAMIQGYGDDGEFVDSYGKAAAAQMRLVVYDRMSTSPERVSRSAFSTDIPKGWKLIPAPTPEKPAKISEPFLLRVLRAAAAADGTTVSVAAEQGGGFLRTGLVHRSGARVRALLATRAPGTSNTQLLVASADGAVQSLDSSGTAVSREGVTPGTDLLAELPADSGTLLVEGTRGDYMVRARTNGGKLKWSRRFAYPVTALATGGLSDGEVHAFVGTEAGLSVLDASGNVRFTSRRLRDPISLAAANLPGAGPRVLGAAWEGGIGVFGRDGQLKGKLHPPDYPLRVLVDEHDPVAPIAVLSTRDGKDVLLRRLKADASVEWTAGVSVGSTEAVPVGFCFARLSPDAGTDGGAGESVSHVALLSDGSLTVFDRRGEPQWRGKVSSEGSSPADFASDLAACDLDADGTDEIYVAADDAVIQMLPRR